MKAIAALAMMSFYLFAGSALAQAGGSAKASKAAVESSWPMYGHDPRRTDCSPHRTLGVPHLWDRKTWGGDCQPAVVGPGGVVYILWNEALVAYYPSGRIKWIAQPEEGYWRYVPPAVDEEGNVYACYERSDDEYLVCSLDPDGGMRWEHPVECRPAAPPAIGSDGKIYIAGGKGNKWPGRVYAFDRNGRLKWYFDAFTDIYVIALGTNGTVYLGGEALYYNEGTPFDPGTQLFALDGDGNLLWTFASENEIPFGQYVQDLAVGGDGTLYGITSHGCGNGVAAFKPDGTLKWVYNNTDGGSLSLGPDGTIYVRSVPINEIVALDPRTGNKKKVLRPVSSDWMLTSDLAVSQNGTLYGLWSHCCGPNDEHLLCAVGTDGRKHWSLSLDSDSGSMDFTEAGIAIGGPNRIYVSLGLNAYWIQLQPR